MCPKIEKLSKDFFTSQEGYNAVASIMDELWLENQNLKKIVYGKKSEKHIAQEAVAQLYSTVSKLKKKNT
jgi:hypothetical protein